MPDTDHDQHEQKTRIIINTRAVETSRRHLDYEEVVRLSDGDLSIRYNVAYRYPHGGKEGTLVPGGRHVEVKEDMIFDVDPTTES